MKYLKWNVGLLKVLLKLGSHDRKLALIRLPTYLICEVFTCSGLFLFNFLILRNNYDDSPSGVKACERVLCFFIPASSRCGGAVALQLPFEDGNGNTSGATNFR